MLTWPIIKTNGECIEKSEINAFTYSLHMFPSVAHSDTLAGASSIATRRDWHLRSSG
jgi:hypothetical protein